MKLFVGLGNPGIQYYNTRHNIGFMVIDELYKQLGFPPYKEKFSSLLTSCTIKNDTIFLQKPLTYMNLSGKAVLSICSFYKILPEDIFVFQDDLDLKFLQVKYKSKSGHGGHNGIKDVQHLLGNSINRIKIGIDKPVDKMPIEKYVLSNFSERELSEINVLANKIANNIDFLINNKFNLFLENIK